MICPNCKQENKDGSRFCNHCGAPLPEAQQTTQKESEFSSILLLIWIAATAILSIISFAYTKFIDNWYEGNYKILYIGIQMFHNIIFILPALVIRNKVMKIIGIIISAIFIIWCLVQNTLWALNVN